MKLTDEMIQQNTLLRKEVLNFFNSHLLLDNPPRAPIKPIHTQCIKWTGPRDSEYGKFSMSRVDLGGVFERLAHIVSYMLFKGYVGNQLVLHECQESLCVNPEHLVLGNHQLNAKHALMNRKTIKPFNKIHKLLTEDVLSIRNLYFKHDYPTKILAEMYKVTPKHIQRILNEEAWNIKP